LVEGESQSNLINLLCGVQKGAPRCAARPAELYAT
jgi:hypothetical protein